ncbi:MAG: hypothetical protein ABUT39_16185 [Acidobacteriota bacterium]
MDFSQPNAGDTAGEPARNPGSHWERRRYEPPRILYREPLEAMAAVCSPVPPAKGNVAFCSQGPISS